LNLKRIKNLKRQDWGTHPQEVTKAKIKSSRALRHKRQDHNNQDTTNTLIKLKTINFRKTLLLATNFSMGI
jgi:hypothetical protein